ncbi:hypothetical protein [Botrimarina sp.]|uniref:hypothetical protein n=1 Tax=Botrimarina sp. TaxID=2795802 RepID=UPI0032EC7DA4
MSKAERTEESIKQDIDRLISELRDKLKQERPVDTGIFKDPTGEAVALSMAISLATNAVVVADQLNEGRSSQEIFDEVMRGYLPLFERIKRRATFVVAAQPRVSKESLLAEWRSQQQDPEITEQTIEFLDALMPFLPVLVYRPRAIAPLFEWV